VCRFLEDCFARRIFSRFAESIQIRGELADKIDV
jgi:hypothetical protein